MSLADERFAKSVQSLKCHFEDNTSNVKNNKTDC